MGSRRVLARSVRWVILALMMVELGSAALSRRVKEQDYFSAKQGAPMAFAISSPSFQDGKDIPKKFTCDGDDVSPALSWMDPPQGVKSFTLIADDPDAPRGTWTHWVLFDLPPSTSSLAEGVPKVGELANGGRQGFNDFPKIGYGGPCPPPGKPHRYFFKLYALDNKLNLKAGASKQEVEQAMQNHILGKAEVMGKYGR